MRPSDVARAITALLPTKRPTYLWGPPGVGKSSVIRQAAQACELDLIDIRAVLLDPVDLRGLPTIKGDTAVWCPPAFLPRGGEGVLFFDEMAQAPPLVQAGLLQLTLDRKIGEYTLPDGWRVLAASNRQEDRAGAHRLISPLLNRFIHLDLEVSNEDWHAWASSPNGDGNAHVGPEVRSFLHYRPGLLFDFDPTAGARAFPTPRSWSFVSDVLPKLPKDLIHPITAGAVGEGPAAELTAFIQIYRELPDPDKVLANPTQHKVPTEPAVLYALTGALVEKVKKAPPNIQANFFTYISRMPDEFGVLAVSDAAQANRQLLLAPGASDWNKRHKHLFQKAK